jgi:DNA-binding transcriptional MocR family regulator
VRQLCAELRASPLTVQKALAQLSREGRIIARPGLGTFRLDAPAQPTPEDTAWQALALGEQPVNADYFVRRLFPEGNPGTIDLTSGYPDETLQPTSLLAAAMARASRRPGVWGKQPPEGNPQLRGWFARELNDCISASDIVVVPGGQAALTTAFRALARPGDGVLMEAPTYLGAIVAARAAGLRTIPVPCDAGGIHPDLLGAAFERTGARMLYAQPTFANPAGVSLSDERRRRVLEVAAQARAFVVEDDYARDLALEGAPPPPLVTMDVGHVVYVRSLTKSTAPSLRVAALCARGQASARLRAARVVDELFVSGPLQEAALELVTSPGWHRHRHHVTDELRMRRDAAVQAIQSLELPVVVTAPAGGYTLWLRLRSGVDDVSVARLALEHGVRVSSCHVWFPAEPSGPFLRLSYFGAGSDAIKRGIVALGRAMGQPEDIKASATVRRRPAQSGVRRVT